MNSQKISPSIWFATEGGKLAPVLEYYQEIFEEDLKAGPIIPLGDTPDGYAEMGSMEIYGQSYTLMSTAKAHHPLNDAVSFIINCEGQQEREGSRPGFAHGKIFRGRKEAKVKCKQIASDPNSSNR